jgi:hypothetical protein
MTWDEPLPRPDVEEDDTPLTGCQPPLWLVGVAFIVVLLACFYSVQLLNVVYGLFFPPSAPRPAELVQLEHESLGFQANRWRYETALHPCEVITFYEDAGGICSFNVGGCGERYEPPVYEVDAFAQCESVAPFSIFGFRWQVSLEPNYSQTPTRTRFELFSEVLWGGMPPVLSSTQD